MQNTSSTSWIRARLATRDRLACAWTITAAVLCIDIAWLALGGWTIAARGVVVLALGVVACVAPLAIARYRRDTRIATTTSFCALLLTFQAAAATLSYLVVGTNAPLVDAPLAAADRALGFDWLALHAWLQGHAAARAVLGVAYHSGLMQLVFVVLFLALTGRRAQLEAFMLLFIAATLLTIGVSGVFPAAGAWKFHAVAGASADLSSLSHFELLRDGRLREIALDRMQGLISIPSLHAAMAVLLVHAVRGTKVVLPVLAALNLAMLASTPVDGGHYFVDVVAGVLLVVVLIALGR
ncbi:MAG TPA: phosphatase PAP2 family protein, partial [Burkholderiaceae bacterium]